MRAGNFIGFLPGMAFTAIGLWWTPFIFRCRLSDFFPLRLPPDPSLENPYCFDCEACAIDTVGALWLLGYFGAVFMASGAVASRIGARQSPVRGAAAVALVFGGTLLYLAATATAVDVSRTAAVGVSAFLVSIACAYGAAYLVTRQA